MKGDKYRDLLTGRRQELADLAASNEEGRQPVTLDQSKVGRLSRMDALQSQAMALEIERRRKQEIIRIEAAMKRIDEGEYGYCVVCRDEIPEKRLEFDPTAPACVDCAGKNA